MKTLIEYELRPGVGSLKYYRYYTPGICTYKTKSKIIEAVNIGIMVYRFDKIMHCIHRWSDTDNKWILESHSESKNNGFNDSYF